MEIIARKKEGLEKLYIFAICLSCVLIVIGVLFAPSSLEYITYLVVGIILLIVSVNIYKKVKNTPTIIVQFDGETLICPDGNFPIREVSNVQFERAYNAKYHYKYSWGKLSIITNGIKHTYDFVEDIEQAQTRLMQLILENKEK